MRFDRRAVADAWIRRAEGHLAHAAAPLSKDPEVECFSAQRAAEMAVKAVFIARGFSHPYIHDIAELLGALEREGVAIPDEVDDAADLTDYATKTGYPGLERQEEPLSERDREEAARLARAVLEWAKGEIARAGG